MWDRQERETVGTVSASDCLPAGSDGVARRGRWFHYFHEKLPRIRLTKPSELYDQDFVLWTEQQAALLRRAKESNLALDWENLAEEIESLGRSDRRELTSQIRRILRHLFKLEVSPASDPRAGWRATIRDARAEIEELLETSPSLRREVEGIIRKQVIAAAKLAVDDLEGHDEPGAIVKTRLAQGGFTAEQVLGDWFPDPPGG